MKGLSLEEGVQGMNIESMLKELETEIYRTAGKEFNVYSAVSVRRMKQKLPMFEAIRLQHLIKAFRELSQIKMYTPLQYNKGNNNDGKE